MRSSRAPASKRDAILAMAAVRGAVLGQCGRSEAARIHLFDEDSVSTGLRRQAGLTARMHGAARGYRSAARGRPDHFCFIV